MDKGPMPNEYTVALALAKLIINEPCESEKIVTTKIEAIQESYARIRSYEKDGFDRELLDVIMEKKASMILNAKSIRDIREIAGIPKPHFDGSTWVSSKNSVPEEEMIMWSKASMIAPLSDEGTARYMELFKQYYDKKHEKPV